MNSREQDLVELVGDAGEPIGAATVEQAHRAPGLQHRAFSVLLFDGLGRTLLQRRAAGKTRFAVRWANACCGHPAPGVPPLTAAVRRLTEELGAPAIVLDPVGVFRYRSADPASGFVEWEYDHVFVGRLPDEVVLAVDPAEVSELDWAHPQELTLAIQASPDRYAPWLAGVLSQAADRGTVYPL